MSNLLIINICKEKFHYFEFVKPIEDIVADLKLKYVIKHYKEIGEKDIENADKIIICGTSLKDNNFMKDFRKFKWLLDYDKPVLGICGGMEIIGLVFGGRLIKKTEKSKSFLKKKTEIGFYREKFVKDFLGLMEDIEVYHLHNYYIDFSLLKNFEIFCVNNKVVQAVKHHEKNIYGVMFHPEVRQKDLIRNFVRL